MWPAGPGTHKLEDNMSDDYTAAGGSQRSEDYGLSETNPIVTGPSTILYDLSLVETGTRYGAGGSGGAHILPSPWVEIPSC